MGGVFFKDPTFEMRTNHPMPKSDTYGYTMPKYDIWGFKVVAKYDKLCFAIMRHFIYLCAMENKLINVMGRLYYYMNGNGVMFKRVDFNGPLVEYIPANGLHNGRSVEDIRKELFGSPSIEVTAKKVPAKEVIVKKVSPPAEKVLGKSLRSVQRERKRNGVSNPVGRPKKVSEIDFSGTMSEVCSKYGISKRTYYRLKK
jgi:hypothetical protein